MSRAPTIIAVLLLAVTALEFGVLRVYASGGHATLPPIAGRVRHPAISTSTGAGNRITNLVTSTPTPTDTPVDCVPDPTPPPPMSPPCATPTETPTPTVTASPCDVTPTPLPSPPCATSTATPTPVDTDGDGYSDAQEIALNENPNVYCAIMRADVNNSGAVSIGDLALAATHFGQTVPPAPARHDQNGSNSISIGDLGLMAARFGQYVSACP